MYVCKCSCKREVYVDTEDLLDDGSAAAPVDLTGGSFVDNDVSQLPQSLFTPVPATNKAAVPAHVNRQRKRKNKSKNVGAVKRLSFGSAAGLGLPSHLHVPGAGPDPLLRQTGSGTGLAPQVGFGEHDHLQGSKQLVAGQSGWAC